IHSPELSALAQERDPELYYEGLLAFGIRQAQVNRLEAAATSFVSILAELEGSGPNPRSHFQNRLAPETRKSLSRPAPQHPDAIQGQGAFGPRAEFLLSRLAQECSDPATLLAMSAGAAAFRLTRLSVLSRLLSSPESVWTRGLGARALAGIS